MRSKKGDQIQKKKKKLRHSYMAEFATLTTKKKKKIRKKFR